LDVIKVLDWMTSCYRWSELPRGAGALEWDGDSLVSGESDQRGEPGVGSPCGWEGVTHSLWYKKYKAVRLVVLMYNYSHYVAYQHPPGRDRCISPDVVADRGSI